ncbi:HAD-IIB family hydrolase [Thalassomonas sp. M1454]|uniref:HAD-IIB family hydrolase n=1 Tax=Thalassomonas sp. M1454 TaxID=2594477 RepID=UPI00163D9062|nr:HAD-IIB family hydrolase [Thalassomonas sp. M1454]
MDNKYIISTDLDGTLLDHNTYKYHKAAPALEYCDDMQIPIIFNTSKTFAETDKLRKQLNNNHPFIIENGAAVYIPKEYFDLPEQGSIPRFDAGEYWIYKFGINRSEILSRLTTLCASHPYKYKGFNSTSTRDLSRDTGLSLEQSAAAQERQFSEPVAWLDKKEKLSEFSKHLNLFGLNCIKGGRYSHVIGQTNKAKPLLFLKALYEQKHNVAQTLISLGDSPNDREMLECADIAVVIESPSHQDPVVSNHPHLIRSRFQGPLGWNESMLNILQVNQESSAVQV